MIFIVLVLFAFLLYYYRMYFGPRKYLKVVKPYNLHKFIEELQPGDVVIFCAQKLNKYNIVEIFLRPLLWISFNTCFVHPVVVVSDDPKRILHWSGLKYRYADGPLCSTGGITNANIYVQNAYEFFTNHVRDHNICVYRMYRKKQHKFINEQTVLTKANEFCGISPGALRTNLQCIYFTTKLLQKCGLISPNIDVYRYSTPGNFEILLRKNSYFHYGDRLIRIDNN